MYLRPGFLWLGSLLIALSLIPTVGATYLLIEGPVTGALNNGSNITLGKVGPGESFYVLASATTTNQSGVAVNIGWDTLEAVNLPSGWSAQASPLYENPMKMKVTVAPDARNSTYELVLRAVNVGNYSKLGNLTVHAFINVTPDVFSASVSSTKIAVGVGQPANLRVQINNTGASDDPFIINAHGLPAWNITDEVIAPHLQTSSYTYPVFVNEPGVYTFNLSVNSATSPLIHRNYTIQLVAKASVFNDYGATGQGVVLSPVIYEPSYALMLLLHYLYGLLR